MAGCELWSPIRRDWLIETQKVEYLEAGKKKKTPALRSYLVDLVLPPQLVDEGMEMKRNQYCDIEVVPYQNYMYVLKSSLDLVLVSGIFEQAY